MIQIIQSYIARCWIGQRGAQTPNSTRNGRRPSQTPAGVIDFGEADPHACRVGLTSIGVGHPICTRLTAKLKTDRNKNGDKGIARGGVDWVVTVVNQHDEIVVSYEILKLVAKQG